MRLIPMIAISSALAMTALPANSSPLYEGVWQLENRGNGGSLGTDYGFGRRTATGWELFDFERNGADVKLTYDASTGNVVIRGQAYSDLTNSLVDLDLSYSGVDGNDSRIGTSIRDSIGTVGGVDLVAAPPNARPTSQSLFLNALSDEGTFNGTGWVGTDSGHYGDFHFAGTQISSEPGSVTASSGGGSGSVPAPAGLLFILLAGAAFFVSRKGKTA